MKTSSIIVITLGLCAIVGISGTGFYFATYQPDHYKYYLLENDNPRLYDIQDHEIKVVIDNMNEEEYNNTVWALNQLDEVLEHDTFKIYDEVPNEHYVRIESVKTLPNNWVGVCYHSEPMLIQVKHSFGNSYWADSKRSVFGKIVLHELGHMLGLKDLQPDEYKGKSIMYYTYAGAQVYTDLDIQNIKRYY